MRWKIGREGDGQDGWLRLELANEYGDSKGIVRRLLSYEREGQPQRWRWRTWGIYEAGYSTTAWGAMSALLRAVQE